ncbi:MAG: DNA repair protein RecN [Gemmatimonadaceae bacterium]|nr:DNA repair protein RecN [Gemmatimonadaceae bacterium]
MLIELRIRNVAIIENVSMTIAPGFSVLTGETGAGKSIIVGALALLLGERGHADMIRTGEDRATVEGVFDTGDDQGVTALLDVRGIVVEDGQVILRREITAGGRSRAWINGSTVTAAQLAEVGQRLVGLHGQHESQALLHPEAQMRMLDDYAGCSLDAERVCVAHAEVQRVVEARRQLAQQRAEAERRSDYLRHVVREIDEAKLLSDEELRLEDEVRRLVHVEDLRKYVSAVSDAMEGDDSGVLRRLAILRRSLTAAERMDPALGRLGEIVESAMDGLAEVSRELRDYESSLDADPDRLRALEQRREVIYRLTAKYGGSVRGVLETLRTSVAELDLVDRAAIDLKALAAKETAAREGLYRLAAGLSEKRQEGASRLGRAVSAQLPDLGMTGGMFEVVLTPLAEPGPAGTETVEFRVTLNVGHESRPLARVASGGELSRVMLALKSVLAQIDDTPTLVFDEVDTGIGGRVALQVGDAMRNLAMHHQVLAITHLAQIAARAHRHVVVSKDAPGGVTTAGIRTVSDEERVAEISRMLGGDASSEASRAHARELLGAAGEQDKARVAVRGRRRC